MKEKFNAKKYKKEDLKAMRDRGMSVKEIAEHYGCCAAHIRKILREYELTVKQGKPLILTTDEAKELIARSESRIQRAKEADDRMMERQLRWKRSRAPKPRYTKTMPAEEIPRGYIY